MGEKIEYPIFSKKDRRKDLWSKRCFLWRVRQPSTMCIRSVCWNISIRIFSRSGTWRRLQVRFFWRRIIFFAFSKTRCVSPRRNTLRASACLPPGSCSVQEKGRRAYICGAASPPIPHFIKDTWSFLVTRPRRSADGDNGLYILLSLLYSVFFKK